MRHYGVPEEHIIDAVGHVLATKPRIDVLDDTLTGRRPGKRAGCAAYALVGGTCSGSSGTTRPYLQQYTGR